MGIGFQSNGTLPTTKSRRNEVSLSQPKTSKSSFGFLSILRLVVTIVEVVAAIGISVVTAGAAAPEAGIAVGAEITGEIAAETAVEGVVEGTVEGITETAVEGVTEGITETTTASAIPTLLTSGQGLVAQTGIALAGSTANLGISIAGNQLNAVATSIDFASALLPGLSELTGGLRNVYKANRIVSRIAKGERSAQFVEAAKEGVFNSTKIGTQRANALSTVSSQAIKNETIDVVKELTDLGLNENEISVLVRIVGEKAIDKTSLKAIASRLSQEANIEEKIALKKLEKISQLSDNLDKLNIGFKTTKASLVKQIQGLTGIEKEDLVKSIWFTRRPNLKVQEYIAGDVLNKISTELVNDDSRDAWAAILRLAKVGKSSDIEKAARMLLEDGVLDEADRAVLADTESVIQALLLTNGKYQSRGSKAIRYFGSMKFNDHFVQPIQAIADPGDLGRAPVEFVYRRTKAKIEKIITNKALKKGEKVLAGLNSIEQKLVDAGWKPMRGDYLWMLKILPGGIPAARLGIMKFRPDSTKSGRGLNKNGKPDVLIRLTDLDIDRLEVEGSSYWWGNRGRKKGWWYSRGGRRKFTGISNQLSEGLSLFLGFVPVNALRLWLSITSNVVENVNSMARGNYTSTYLARLERSFVRSAFNRSIRLGTRVALGGAATKLTNANSGQFAQFLFGKAFKNGVVRSGFVGREFQRFAVSAAQAFEGVDANTGLFKFNTKGYAARVQTKATLGAVTSIRSNLLRQARSKGVGNVITANVGYNRKFSQVRRVASAVTPNDQFQSRNFGRIKL